MGKLIAPQPNSLGRAGMGGMEEINEKGERRSGQEER